MTYHQSVWVSRDAAIWYRAFSPWDGASPPTHLSIDVGWNPSTGKAYIRDTGSTLGIIYSSDGVNWTTGSGAAWNAPTGLPLPFVSISDALGVDLVAMGSVGSGLPANTQFSTNTTSFAQSTGPFPSSTSSPFDSATGIGYDVDNSRFIVNVEHAVGGGNSQSQIFTSTDGNNFTHLATPTQNARRFNHIGGFTGVLLAFVPGGGLNPNHPIVYSTDGGTTWNNVTSTPSNNANDQGGAFAYNGTTYVAAGDWVGTSTGAWYSTDHLTWTNATSAPRRFTNVKWVSALGLFVAAASIFASGRASIYTSPDGINWTNQPGFPTPTNLTTNSTPNPNGIVYASALGLLIATALVTYNDSGPPPPPPLGPAGGWGLRTAN